MSEVSDSASHNAIPLGAPIAGDGAGDDASTGVGPQPIMLRGGASAASVTDELFDRIGGAPTFDRLVRTFYAGVQSDPVLWPMYPAHDLEGAIERLSTFLQQYWGGPATYSERRGHPRLRMRHMPFAITPNARDHWLTHMRHAVDSLELAPLDDATLWSYLDRAAHALVNSFDE